MLSVESRVLSGQPPLPIAFETQEVSKSAARKTDTMFFIFFIANVKRMRHYQRGRKSHTGLMVELGKIIETERLVVVAWCALFAVGLVEDGWSEGIGSRDLGRNLIDCQRIEFNSGELTAASKNERSAKIVVGPIEIVTE